MDSWILKQLRAKVLSDLIEYIPNGFFEQKLDEFELNDHFKGHKHLSNEMNWGYLAIKLGKELFTTPPIGSTAQQVSASELLMNLGLLASAEANFSSTKQLSDNAISKGLPDGNSGNVSRQLQTEHIPTFKANVQGALEQYLHYLSYEEMRPYLSLLPESKQKELELMGRNENKVITNTINIKGSNNGCIQTGENNTNANPKPQSGILTWILGVVGAVISGVVVYYLTSGA